MSEVLTLQLPDELARQARAFADATNRPLEDVILDWISQAVADPAVETLADNSLLALCDLTLEPAQQEELSKLLERAQEGELETDDRDHLDLVMARLESPRGPESQSLRFPGVRDFAPGQVRGRQATLTMFLLLPEQSRSP